MAKPEPKLSQMPLHIKELIVETIHNWKTKQSLSFLSKDFNYCVKNSSMRFYTTKISMQLLNNKIIVEVRCECWKTGRKRKLTMEFIKNEKGALIRNPKSKWEKVFEGEDYRKAAVRHMMSFFKNREREVNTLELKVGDDLEKFEEDRQVLFDELHSILQRFHSHMLITGLDLKFQVTEHQILPILTHIEPRYLHTINLHICSDSPPPFLDLTAICETEQWKKATIVRADSYITNVPLEKWMHTFSSLQWREPMVTITEIQEMLILSKNTTMSIQLARPFNAKSFAEYIAPLNHDNQRGGFEFEMRPPDQPYDLISIKVDYGRIYLSREFEPDEEDEEESEEESSDDSEDSTLDY